MAATGLLLTGCGSTPADPFSRPPGSTGLAIPPSSQETLLHAVIGKVKYINPSLRFVVIEFPVGRMPGADQRLDVYRAGERIGRVKITGPFLEISVAADIVFGDAAVGDEVRAN